MGTISEKLTYLNETKQELKQAINNLGGEIDNNTTFREYVEELQDIYDNAPKTSYGEGTNISLANTLKGKLDFDNLLYGDVEQDTLTGYNLLNANANTQTLNGVTCTNNGNGTFTINGTATAQTLFNLEGMTLDTSQTYTLSGCPTRWKWNYLFYRWC